MTKEEYVRKEARKELARRFFYDYCQLRFPDLYKTDRIFLRELCDGIQSFVRQNEKRFLVINLPPRHFKSLTGTNAVEWILGENPKNKIMTGSYNETLSTTFARKVRDTIDEEPSLGTEVYRDVFPGTRVKYGQASKSLWSLEGSGQDNYLATSPTGTATGFGANYILIDDIIKNKEEAFNRLTLEKHWDWFTNTMLSRTEGDSWKVIVIMTRWAKEDLAGRIIENFGDLVETISFTAVQPDGSMLCGEVLNRTDFDIKTKEMAEEIVQANYNQKPIDVQGRLYESFQTYSDIPEEAKGKPVMNYTDTADKGSDFLCSVSYVEHEGSAYVTGIVMSDKPMEFTESMVAEMLSMTGTKVAEIESNNGGRGFGRNVERLLAESGNRGCVINEIHQTGNKEARILSSSAWVQRNVLMPENWKRDHREFAEQLLSYQRKGKNAHDDAPDVLAGIYEKVANERKVQYAGIR